MKGKPLTVKEGVIRRWCSFHPHTWPAHCRWIMGQGMNGERERFAT